MKRDFSKPGRRAQGFWFKLAHSRVRRRAGVALATATIGGIVLGQSGVFPQIAQAYDTPTDSPGPRTQGGYLPAPNPTAYCASPDYFGRWSRAQALKDAGGGYELVVNDSARTHDDGSGITADFSAVAYTYAADGTPTTPGVWEGNPNAPLGIVLQGIGVSPTPASGNITFDKPLFFSQWVYPDTDLNGEGFDLTPSWATGNADLKALAIYGGDPANPNGNRSWSFTPTSGTSIVKTNSGSNTGGETLEGRVQADFLGPLNGFFLQRTGTGNLGFIGGTGCAAIGLSKEATEPVWDPVTKTFVVDYTVRVFNNMPTVQRIQDTIAAGQASSLQDANNVNAAQLAALSQLIETNLQITDSLDKAGFADAVVSTPPASPDGATVNPNFDGVTDTSLLAGTDSLEQEGTRTVTFSVTYTPDFASPEWADCSAALPNQATTSAKLEGISVSDLSDNGSDPKPAAENGGGGVDDPTPVEFSYDCGIGLAKSVTSGPTSNGDGTYDVEYTFIAENVGTVPLYDVTINDDLDNAFGAAYQSSTVDSDGCAPAALPDGLAPAATCTKVITVKIKPAGSLGPWENSASVDAKAGDPTGPTVSDVSQDGSDVDPDGDGDPSNNSDPTVIDLKPQIGLSKEVTGGPTSNGDGTYDIEYTLTAVNTGPVYLTDVKIEDGLLAAFKGDYVSADVVDNCAGVGLNTDDTCDNVVTVTVRPTTETSWENSATVTADGGGVPVTDTSQNGPDVDPDDDGDPGNNSDPTPVTIVEKPEITLVKSVTAGPTNNGDGTYTVDYSLLATNTGNVPLSNVMVTDDLAAVFGTTLVSSQVTSDECTRATLIAPPAQPTDMTPYECEKTITVVFRPAGSLGPFDNTATATGVSPKGTTVSDDSTASVTATEAPAITLTKEVTAGPTNNTDGTYDVTYTLVATNTGDVPLTPVVIDDDLTAAFGSALVSATPTDGCAGKVLAPSEPAGAGDTCTLTVVVVAKPGATMGPYDNNATVSGKSPIGTEVTDTADATVSFTENPEIGLSKQLVGDPVNNGDGTYSLKYELVATNTGDVELSDVTIDDDLLATYGSKLVSATPTDGCADVVLAPSDPPGSGDSCTLTVDVVVKPGAELGPYNNSATTTGTAPSGAEVTDVSQNGSEYDPDGDGDPSNNSDPTPAQFTESPQIGLTKSISAGPTSNDDGTFNLTYTITATNTGDVALTGIAVDDDLSKTFGAKLVSSKVTDDCADVTLFPEGAVGEGNMCVVKIDVVVKPGSKLCSYDNTASVTGTSPAGTEVADDSQDTPPNVTNPDANGNGDPTDDSEPTSVCFDEHPSLGTAKAAFNLRSTADGKFAVDYLVTVQNLGDVELKNLKVTDNLGATFGANRFTVSNLKSSSLSVNSKFTGVKGANTKIDTDDLLAGTDTLGANQTGTITFTVTFDPGCKFGPFANTAKASAKSPAGTSVGDDSMDGTLVDPNKDGSGLDNNKPTLVSVPAIGATKSVVTNGANGDGTHNVVYEVAVTNIGKVALSNVQLTDDLKATFAGTTSWKVNKIVSATLKINPKFNGDSDKNLLAGTDSLKPNGFGVVRVAVTITPGKNLGPYNNSAVASGAGPASTLPNGKTVPGPVVSDKSQNTSPGSTNPDANGNGCAADDNEITPVDFNENPEIGITKKLDAEPLVQPDGSFDMSFTMVVTNTGDVPLTQVSAKDNLRDTFGATATIKVKSISATAPGTADTTYDGINQVEMLKNTSLNIGESTTITLKINMAVDNKFSFLNQAYTTGVSPAGKQVKDSSQDGAANDPDNDGNPTNNNDPTPIVIPPKTNPVTGANALGMSGLALGLIGLGGLMVLAARRKNSAFAQ